MIFLLISIMRKLITGAQMLEADLDCLRANNITSIDLMEKAALAFSGVLCGLVPEKSQPILIVCGTGNNGGDGLAIARILQCTGYSCIRVLIVHTGSKESPDFLINLQRLRDTPVLVNYFNDGSSIDISENIIVDAILGSGVDRPIGGDLLRLVKAINQSQKRVIAVDCPSGFPSDGEFKEDEEVLKAWDVVSFQRPKLNFFFPESVRFLRHFHVVDIGLREEFIESLTSNLHNIENADITRIYKKRQSFSHKGTFGHAYLYAGSQGKSGAALLCAEACVYSGAGLTSVGLPENDRVALHARLPEAMYMDCEAVWESEVWSKFSAIALGPGLGETPLYIEPIILHAKVPLVIDADALNFLAKNPHLLSHFRIGKKTAILTPHMKEFDRLFGKSESWWARLQLAIAKAKEFGITIILKNRYTFIVLANGRVLINPTGNPAMASGGMGDVLTGIIVSFLAQGYNVEEASILACYIHGRAGDLLATAGNAVIPASRLIAKIPFVIGEIE